jgi:aminocarboxymuconate-semialdehyde decarboxylase
VVFGGGLARLIELVGPEHVVLGSDYPYDMGDGDPLARLDGIAGLTPHQRSAIAGGTAAHLLGVSAASSTEPAAVGGLTDG